MNKGIDDIIDRLTHNNKYASDICLLLYFSKSASTIHSLDKLDITGKNLETLVYKCLPEVTLDSINQTVRYLSSGFLSKDDIHYNLNSSEPVVFIDRLIQQGEDYENLYEHYSASFNTRLKNNKR